MMQLHLEAKPGRFEHQSIEKMRTGGTSAGRVGLLVSSTCTTGRPASLGKAGAPFAARPIEINQNGPRVMVNVSTV